MQGCEHDSDLTNLCSSDVGYLEDSYQHGLELYKCNVCNSFVFYANGVEVPKDVFDSAVAFRRTQQFERLFEDLDAAIPDSFAHRLLLALDDLRR